jgi:hypothetical protein
VAGNSSSAAAHFPGDLFVRQTFEDPQLYHSPECRMDGGEPVHNIVEFEQRMLDGRRRARQVEKLGSIRTPRERTGLRKLAIRRATVSG